MKKCFVYIGEDDPPDYCPENFVDQDDLVLFLERNCRTLKGKVMDCPKCKRVVEHKHMHDCAHGIPETHMTGSERYECVECGHSVRKVEGEKQGLQFVLD